MVDRFSSHPTIKGLLTNIQNTNIWRQVQGDAAATVGSAPSLFDQLLNRDDVQTGISYITKQVKEVNIDLLTQTCTYIYMLPISFETIQ